MSLLLQKRKLESQRSNGLNDPVVKPQQTTMMNQNLSSNFLPTANTENQSGYEVTPRQTLMNVAQQRPPRSYHREQSAPIKSLLQHSYVNVSKKPKTVDPDVTPEWTVPLNSMTYPTMDYQSQISPEVIKSLNLPEGSYFEAPVYIDPATGKPIVVETEHLKKMENLEQHDGRIIESDFGSTM